jgi:hypothetical protein
MGGREEDWTKKSGDQFKAKPILPHSRQDDIEIVLEILV